MIMRGQLSQLHTIANNDQWSSLPHSLNALRLSHLAICARSHTLCATTKSTHGWQWFCLMRNQPPQQQ